jgi:hypothetical protein
MPARNLKNPGRPRHGEDSSQSSPTSPFPSPHSPSSSHRRGSDATNYPMPPSGYTNPPQFAPYRSRTRSNSGSSAVPYPYQPLESPPAGTPGSPPSGYFQYPRQSSAHNGSYPQRPISTRPPYYPSDPSASSRWPPSIQTEALVPLPQLEESRAATHHRSPTDNDILRRFQPRSQ